MGRFILTESSWSQGSPQYVNNTIYRSLQPAVAVFIFFKLFYLLLFSHHAVKNKMEGIKNNNRIGV
jgi:hypothetical protein